MRLLVTHYAVEGFLHPSAEEPTIKKASIAALAGRVDALLLGHIHDGRETDIAGVKVIFPGPTERTNFGELDVRCGFTLLSVQGPPPYVVRSKQIHLHPQPMRRQTVRATDIPEEDPTAWLVSEVQSWSEPDQILQVRLEGPLKRDTYHALRFLEVWQVGNDLNFYFDLDRHALTLKTDDFGTGVTHAGIRVSPRSEIQRVADAMLEIAGSDAERQVLEEARALVLEQYGAGTVEEGE